MGEQVTIIQISSKQLHDAGTSGLAVTLPEPAAQTHTITKA